MQTVPNHQNTEHFNDLSFNAQPFNQHAYEWWDEEGLFKTLHHINPIRANWIQNHLQNHLTINAAQANILDVGCGGGLLTEALANLSYNLQGIDIAPDLIEVAQLHAMQSGLPIQYHCQNFDTFAVQNTGKFNAITCMEMLEHVDDPKAILQSCHQALSTNGLLFVSTINRTLKAYTQAILLAEHVLKIVPKYTHFYEKFIQPHELITMLEQTGFKVLGMDGLSYNPWLKQKAKVVDDVSINYMLACQKL